MNPIRNTGNTRNNKFISFDYTFLKSMFIINFYFL